MDGLFIPGVAFQLQLKQLKELGESDVGESLTQMRVVTQSKWPAILPLFHTTRFQGLHVDTSFLFLQR